MKNNFGLRDLSENELKTISGGGMGYDILFWVGASTYAAYSTIYFGLKYIERRYNLPGSNAV